MLRNLLNSIFHHSGYSLQLSGFQFLWIKLKKKLYYCVKVNTSVWDKMCSNDLIITLAKYLVMSSISFLFGFIHLKKKTELTIACREQCPFSEHLWHILMKIETSIKKNKLLSLPGYFMYYLRTQSLIFWWLWQNSF